MRFDITECLYSRWASKDTFMKYGVSKMVGIYDKWGRVVNAMIHQK